MISNSQRFPPHFPAIKLFQEKLEQYLFKLRIAERKGREAKVAKMHKKIDRMRRQLSGESIGSGDEGEEVSRALYPQKLYASRRYNNGMLLFCLHGKYCAI